MSTSFYLITVESAIAAPAGDLLSLGSPRGSARAMLCAIFFALYDTLWTGPRWRLLVSANLPAAWTPNLLCPLQLPSRTVEFPVSQFPLSRLSIFSWESFGRCTILTVSTSRLYCTYPTHTWHQCCICRWVTNNWCVPTCTGTVDVLPSGSNRCDY